MRDGRGGKEGVGVLGNNPRKNWARAEWKKTNRAIGTFYIIPNGFHSGMKWISYRVYMQDNLDYKNK